MPLQNHPIQIMKEWIKKFYEPGGSAGGIGCCVAHLYCGNTILQKKRLQHVNGMHVDCYWYSKIISSVFTNADAAHF